MKIKVNKRIFVFLFIAFISFSSEAAETETSWEQWVSREVIADRDPEAVQNRSYSKENRIQMIAPMVGLSERKDFYNSTIFSFGARYHFSEVHGWELIRFSYVSSQLSEVGQQVRDEVEFEPNVQLAKFQLSSSYVYTPIYGKYAWGTDSVVHFDVFGSIGLGARFARDLQYFGVVGVGMNHFLGLGSLSLVPEYRARIYYETRDQNTIVFESLFQLGASWLF